jgi:hypothetical protein
MWCSSAEPCPNSISCQRDRQLQLGHLQHSRTLHHITNAMFRHQRQGAGLLLAHRAQRTEHKVYTAAHRKSLLSALLGRIISFRSYILPWISSREKG